ncbi:MAG: hypothetical protein LBU34_00430 [Planctomycetaceae bacterium]|nr:hypothetical protein [Planctomycetaceae bacterium]
MCITVGGAKCNLRIGISNPLQKQKVGGVSPKRRLPIGNRNNQHYINSSSANADATVTARGFHPTVAYLVISCIYSVICPDNRAESP